MSWWCVVSGMMTSTPSCPPEIDPEAAGAYGLSLAMALLVIGFSTAVVYLRTRRERVQSQETTRKKESAAASAAEPAALGDAKIGAFHTAPVYGVPEPEFDGKPGPVPRLSEQFLAPADVTPSKKKKKKKKQKQLKAAVAAAEKAAATGQEAGSPKKEKATSPTTEEDPWDEAVMGESGCIGESNRRYSPVAQKAPLPSPPLPAH